MREDDFKALEAHWHKLYDQYDAVKSMLLPVVRWEWANTERYDPRPFYFQRHPPRGRILNHPPIDENQRNFHYEYGFDEQDRVTIRRYFTSSGLWETFYIYIPNEITAMEFSMHQGRHLLSHIEQGVMQSDRMQHYTSLKVDYSYINPSQTFPALGQSHSYQGPSIETATAEEIWTRLSDQKYAIKWDHEIYIYQDNRLVLSQEYWLFSLWEPFINECHFDYSETGHLQKITWVQQGGHQRVLYRRRTRGETLASLTEMAKQKLIEAIPKVIANAKLNEPLYCLNLYYFLAKAGDYFPPDLFPGFERDRQRKLLEYPPDQVDSHLWWYLWDTDKDEPEHVPHAPLLISDLETLEACERLDTEINMRRNSALAVKTLYQLARELNHLDWSQYTPVMPDFIVYACDQTEHIDVSVSLFRSGATKKQLIDWHQRGMLQRPLSRMSY